MVVEDDNGIVGYALAALNIKEFNQKLAVSWIPEMKSKYHLEELKNNLPQEVEVR